MTKVTREAKDDRRANRRQEHTAAEIIERTLPHSIEAEQAVLGAIIMHNDAFLTANRHVAATDFFREAHRRVYAALTKLLGPVGGSADFLTLSEELQTRGDLDEVGGKSYLAKLIDGVPRSTNVGHYAAIVKEKARLRECIYVGNKLTTAGYDATEPSDAIIERADKEIIELRHGGLGSSLQSTKHSSDRLLTELEYRAAHRGELTGVTSGFGSIDGMTMGWQAGDMIVLGARPSIGKTTLVLNMAVAACRSVRSDNTPRRVVIYSLEMKREQLEMRLLSQLSGVPLTTIMGGWTLPEQYGLLTNAIGELSEFDLYIDDTARRSVWDVRGRCRELMAEGGLDLLIIDYLQLMEGEGKSRYEVVTGISRDLKVMAGELRCPTIVLSQLSRANDQRPDPRPKLSDLRESGAIEQDADIVGFLHRKHHREGGATEFFIEKARNIDGGSTYLTLHRELTKFEDGGEPPPAPTPAEKKAVDQHARTRKIIQHRARQKD